MVPGEGNRATEFEGVWPEGEACSIGGTEAPELREAEHASVQGVHPRADTTCSSEYAPSRSRVRKIKGNVGKETDEAWGVLLACCTPSRDNTTVGIPNVPSRTTYELKV